jgi:CubicO group peptidase (beta-lactamase class C family)
MRAWLGALLMVLAGLPGAARAQSEDAARKVEAALSALQPAVQVTGRDNRARSLQELMQQANVPGVSIAVFLDGRIVYARGFGVAQAGAPRAVTPDTLFQAASISKPVTATAALALVEQGTLDLDAPVNAKLRSWQVPDSAAAQGEPVTLRRLLTHTAGLTVHGFPGYAAGAQLPTVSQILDGVAPANTAAVRVDQPPGSAWRYSGGGFTVAQLLMAEVTGEPFPELLRRLVLTRADMAHSTFAQPLPADRVPAAALGHRADGTLIAGGFNAYPEMAAAGLWTTPSDLARWALALSRALEGAEDGLLRPETAAAMLTPGMGNFGLGIGVAGQDEWLRMSHNGANEGYRADLTAFPRRGEGIVIMTNSDSGTRLFAPIVITVGKALGWPVPSPRVITPVEVPAQALEDAAGRYTGFGQTVDVRVNGQVLRVTIANGPPPSDLFPQGNDLYLPEEGPPIRFVRDAAGKVTGLAAPGGVLERTGDAP